MTIQEMRRAKGYSQSELAKRSGINLRSLQDYEQGHKSVISAKGETLYRLSRVWTAASRRSCQRTAVLSISPKTTQIKR